VFVVEKNGKFNFIHELNVALSPVVYDFCYLYPGFAVVRKGSRAGNLFFHEGLSEPASYRTVHVFEVKRGKYYGVETAQGDTLLACQYPFVKVYPDFILTGSDGGFSLFHTDGRKMFDECFDDVDVSEKYREYVYVQKNEKWGVVHLRGHWIVPACFQSSCEISEMYDDFHHSRFFECSLNDLHCPFSARKGLYNMQGKLIIPFEYKYEYRNYDWGYHVKFPAIVSKNGKYGMIDRRGTVIFPCVYDEIMNDGASDYYRIKKEGTDSIWHIPDVFELSETEFTSENYQLMDDSSCFDFLRMPCPAMCFDDENREKIRRALIGNVCSTKPFRNNCAFLTEYLKEINIELSSLFELERIREDRNVVILNNDTVQSDCYVKEFSSSYQLAGVYFEGKEVMVNYQNAFELYHYCLEDIIRMFDCISDEDYYKCIVIAYRIGWMLYTGNGTEMNRETGLRLISVSRKCRNN
jgi:hypothetical protein